jgi:hypothetical protein
MNTPPAAAKTEFDLLGVPIRQIDHFTVTWQPD